MKFVKKMSLKSQQRKAEAEKARLAEETRRKAEEERLAEERRIEEEKKKVKAKVAFTSLEDVKKHREEVNAQIRTRIIIMNNIE